MSTPPSRSQETKPNKKVVVITGATSVGKSSVAMEFCQRLGAEIVISDAVQVYSHLDIGSNKPTVEDRELVPHHLLDLCHPSTVMTTGDYYRQATSSILEIQSRGKLPVVVGGSTMWVQWLVQGVPDAPKASEEISMQAENMLKSFRESDQWEEGLAVLRKYDSHKVVNLNDWYRLQRALEIALQIRGGVEASLQDSTQEGPLLSGVRTSLLPEDIDFRTVFISENREQLYNTIDQRCVEMLRLGHLREVTDLLLDGHLQPEYIVAKSIGYRQTIAYLAQTALDSEHHPLSKQQEMEAFLKYLDEFCMVTRNYAKRQLNWYRKDKNFLFVRSRRNILSKGLADTKTSQEVQHWASVPRGTFDAAVAQQLAVHDALTELRLRSKPPHDYQPNTHERRLALSWLINTGEVRVPVASDLLPKPVEETEELSKGERKRRARLEFKRARKEAAAEAEGGEEIIVTTTGENTEPKGIKFDPMAGLPPPVRAVAAVPRELPQWVASIMDETQGVTPNLLKNWSTELSCQVPDVRNTAGDNDKLQTYTSRALAKEAIPTYAGLIEEAIVLRTRLLAQKKDVLRRFLVEEQKN